MNITPEELADGRRDVLALAGCYLDGDEEGLAAILAAQDDYWPLARAAVALLISVVAGCGVDPRAWVAEARAEDSRAPRQP